MVLIFFIVVVFVVSSLRQGLWIAAGTWRGEILGTFKDALVLVLRD
jgi:hypothetical protein